MSNDFITLTCPSCGGKLEISSNTTSLKCPNCGNEHIVRRDAANIFLESFARCPVCGRNDKSEKVSSIIRSQTHELNGSIPVSRTYTDNNGKVSSYTSTQPFTGTQISNLAQSLQPPQQPLFPQKHRFGNYFWLGFVLYLAICGAGYIVWAAGNSYDVFASLPLSFVLEILDLILIVILISTWKKKWSIENGQYQSKMDEYQKRLNTWHEAMNNWENLYYCYRDACIYIPGKNKSSSVEKIYEYLVQK